MVPFDVLIVGSGPSGVQAAAAAVDRGARVALADIGETDPSTPVPEQPYAQLRSGDPDQHRYLLGDPDTALADLGRAGAHLTPPRRYMVRGADHLLGLASDTFRPLQSTSAGGLGVSWGANVYTLTDAELRRVGFDPAAVRPFYEQVAADIGVSGADDAFGRSIADLPNLQPPLAIDGNAQRLLQRYQTAAAGYERVGFRMGQAALAVLSRDRGDRRANPLHDMDFYADSGRSVYRPQFTLEALQRRPNFTYLPGRLATTFSESDGTVTLRCLGGETITSRRLILAAGAINTGRLVLQSLPQHGGRLPILCNPNHWVAAINLAQLGRPAGDARYSLAQLAALQRVGGEDVLAQFYSYRSLLTFRVLRGIPLPPRLGVKFMRLIATAFTCVNLHFADEPADTKYVELDGDTFRAHYAMPAEQARAVRRGERAMLRRLVGLRCLPIGVARPSPGASIHYAGTLPHGDGPLNTAVDGRLNATRHVYVGDGSSWRWLPAKGLTFTLMANARRVAEAVVTGLNA